MALFCLDISRLLLLSATMVEKVPCEFSLCTLRELVYPVVNASLVLFDIVAGLLGVESL